MVITEKSILYPSINHIKETRFIFSLSRLGMSGSACMGMQADQDIYSPQLYPHVSNYNNRVCLITALNYCNY